MCNYGGGGVVPAYLPKRRSLERSACVDCIVLGMCKEGRHFGIRGSNSEKKTHFTTFQ